MRVREGSVMEVRCQTRQNIFHWEYKSALSAQWIRILIYNKPPLNEYFSFMSPEMLRVNYSTKAHEGLYRCLDLVSMDYIKLFNVTIIPLKELYTKLPDIDLEKDLGKPLVPILKTKNFTSSNINYVLDEEERDWRCVNQNQEIVLERFKIINEGIVQFNSDNRIILKEKDKLLLIKEVFCGKSYKMYIVCACLFTISFTTTIIAIVLKAKLEKLKKGRNLESIYESIEDHKNNLSNKEKLRNNRLSFVSDYLEPNDSIEKVSHQPYAKEYINVDVEIVGEKRKESLQKVLLDEEHPYTTLQHSLDPRLTTS